MFVDFFENLKYFKMQNSTFNNRKREFQQNLEQHSSIL